MPAPTWMVMDGPIQLMICQWIQPFGVIQMMMVMEITSEACPKMHVLIRPVPQQSIATDALTPMTMATPHRRKVGVSTVEQMLSQAIPHNGVILMRMVSVTTTGTLLGQTGLRTGLGCSKMERKTKTPVLCSQEQAGKTASLVAQIRMAMAGGMFKTHSLSSPHNGRMLMGTVMVTMQVVLMQMLVQTLEVIQQLIVLDASIPMVMDVPTLN